MSDQTREQARSFGAVAETYDRARPSYPVEAAEYLVGRAGTSGGDPKRVLELGAGTGKLTELLVRLGHHVIATDPSPEMLGHLRLRAPGAETMVAVAEHLPVASRSVDVVVCAQSFHWFDHEAALAEITRVLRPGGTLALVWNFRDEGIPWVRKLGRIIGSGGSTDHTAPVEACDYFGELEEREYRFWQDLRKGELLDLVSTRGYVAPMPDHERAGVLDQVADLYDDYGRGPDGMKLPYLTRCYKTTVVNQPPPPVVMARVEDSAIALVDSDVADGGEDAAADERSALPPSQPNASGVEDTGTVLIDFR